MTQVQFVSRMVLACTIAKQKGATINTPAVIAQSALESGWGNSGLTRKANNLFGIKAPKGWTGETLKMLTYEWDRVKKKYYQVIATWCVYPSWNECIVHYSNVVRTRWWFKDALPYADDPVGNGDSIQWIAHLVDRDVEGELAWATGPNYTAKVAHLGQEIENLGRPKWGVEHVGTTDTVR